jgi:SulP family sulfate permease
VIAIARGEIGALLPGRADYDGVGRSWRGDVTAGVTVAVVALPLALAFGITTGLGAAAGLTTAIVAGIVAGVFGGSNFQVSGPTGAMTVVLVPLVAHDGPAAVATIGVLAGIIVVAAGALRLGRFLAFIPWPVIEGFTVGIAAIIFLQQVPSALGVAKPPGENTAAVAARALGSALDSGSLRALALVAVVVAVMVAVSHRLPRLPASLVGVAAATGLGELLGWHVARIGSLPDSLSSPALPGLPFDRLGDYLPAALAVAALAAIESLLSAKVADGMADAAPHDPDRELVGQGLANVVSPLFGGMPATGAIARTAVSVRAGARTRVATLVHAGTLLVVVLVAGPVVARIPLAALAGVLMVTAAHMIDRHAVRAVVRSTRSDAIVLGLTAVSTVAIGIVVAGLLTLRKVARAVSVTPTAVEIEVDADLEHALLHDRILAYRIDGALFFGAAQRFLDELTRVSDAEVVILRLPGLQVLDATGAQALGAIVDQLEQRGIIVLMKGPRPEHERILTAVGALERVRARGHLFVELADAVAHARTHVGRAPVAPRPC